MSLSNNSDKFWAPISNIRDWLENKCKDNKYSKIIEVQPGFVPISFATDKIDYSVDKIDLDTTVLNHSDQSFDFLYCRHVLEDLQNPDFAFREMARISQNGFIETPSPLVECTRNVDANSFAHLYLGYIHHRYITWTELETNTLCFLPKLPIIEHIEFKTETISALSDAFMWNNYYLWSNEQPARCKIYKHGIDFDILKDYVSLLNHAILQSTLATNTLKQEWNT